MIEGACASDAAGQHAGDDERQPMAHLRPLSVLLADDFEANRILQQAQLEELGYPTDVVTNGEEVLRALNARSYDVVLLDIGMPVMDGLETARRVRARKGAPRPFLVAVTGSTDGEERRRIIDAGFDAYIAKPAGLCEFAEALAQAYAKKSGPGASPVAASAANDDSLILDLGVLYARIGPAADGLLRRVIPVYLRELPGRQAGLRRAVDARDPQTLAQICHGLKGASRVVGATELAGTCERIEERAFDGRLPGAGEVDELLGLARRSERELRRKLATLQA